MASTSTSTSVSDLLARADTLAKSNPKEAEALYKQILTSTSSSTAGTNTTPDPTVLRDQETALVKLGELYRDQKYAAGLAEVITASRAFMSSTAKAKTAKLIRTLLDFFSAIPNSQQIQIKTLTDNIAWAKQEKRIFLKHSLETRLVALQLEARQFTPALALIETLLTELKKLDDKMILTEVHLLESRVYRGIGNMAKAKASLTSSRTAANSIYCPPYLQSQLDMQSGILHAEDKDYSTAYSYFFEAFENLSAAGEEGLSGKPQDKEKEDGAKEPGVGGDSEKGKNAQGQVGQALSALKYMLLCKVMLNLPEDVNALLTLKLANSYAQTRDVQSMRAVARAHQRRDLKEFGEVLREYREELQSDPTIRTHLSELYDTLFEGNLKRVVEPYSVVEIGYVAEQVGQERQSVESKLSKMILDKTLFGVLDQGRDCLIIYDEPEADNTYGAAIDTIEQISKVVESLYAKTVKIA
uniref:PCI domain-containing protein n=1 Tax=Psilocybe cubensis TaxID=181762 RepID=A0A8H7Y212_PSICU